jgi:hypothetical protein
MTKRNIHKHWDHKWRPTFSACRDIRNYQSIGLFNFDHRGAECSLKASNNSRGRKSDRSVTVKMQNLLRKNLQPYPLERRKVTWSF